MATVPVEPACDWLPELGAQYRLPDLVDLTEWGTG